MLHDHLRCQNEMINEELVEYGNLTGKIDRGLLIYVTFTASRYTCIPYQNEATYLLLRVIARGRGERRDGGRRFHGYQSGLSSKRLVKKATP